MIDWRDLDEEKPADGQTCLTKTKHGIIEGDYCKADCTFAGYYWREMEWFASHWIPIEEVL